MSWLSLKKMWIIMKTASVRWAGTNADLQVDVTTNYNSANFRSLGLGPEALGEGRFYELECDIEGSQIDHLDMAPSSIRITVTPDDAWLPEKFWIIGKTTDSRYHLLGVVVDWPENSWFSTGPV